MRTFLLIIGSLACSMAGIAQGVEPAPPLLAPPTIQNVTPPAQPVPPVSPPSVSGESLPTFRQPPPLSDDELQRRIKERYNADPLTRKPEAGDDELRRLLKERYNAALFAFKNTIASYEADRGSFDDLVSTSALMLHAELELSDKPADQIAAIERYLEIAKQQELRVFSHIKSGRRGGEADKYEKAKYMRLDAEIQLLRARQKAAATKP